MHSRRLRQLRRNTRGLTAAEFALAASLIAVSLGSTFLALGHEARASEQHAPAR